MFSAVERTGSYKMWSQVLPSVSRGIYAKDVFLDFLAESFGFIFCILFLTFISDVYWMHISVLVPTLSVLSSTGRLQRLLVNLLFHSDGHPTTLLLVIKDLAVNYSNISKTYVTRGSHHRNLSVIYIVQNLFHQGKGSRSISLNSHYLVLFKNPRDKLQILTLAMQMYLGQTDFFLN